ncbi:hypothetical protein YTPLAS18_34040 [Nitrospira sp.]|nr:hypothetical protein YTPLAS18_33940 [Nitrospira sp.]GKS59877.1 hypothetical protein YTPLAS18_34040 [Nitrospira sp.]
MTKGDVIVGNLVRVVVDRWDAPTGTLARVDTVGRTADLWCFTVVWLTRASPVRRTYSLNLFEEDLPCFEVFEGPMPTPVSSYVKPSRAAAARKEHPLQLPLPFVNDSPEERNLTASVQMKRNERAHY